MRGELFSLVALLLNSVVQKQLPERIAVAVCDTAAELASAREAYLYALQAVNTSCVCPACPVAPTTCDSDKADLSLWKPAAFGAGGTVVANLIREAFNALSLRLRRSSLRRYGGRVAPARRGGGMVT